MNQHPAISISILSIPSPPPPGVVYVYAPHTGSSYFVRTRLRKDPRD
jgi:hypothetical protein